MKNKIIAIGVGVAVGFVAAGAGMRGGGLIVGAGVGIALWAYLSKKDES